MKVNLIRAGVDMAEFIWTMQAEQLHGDTGWELDTILEEEANCYLYEKMGYYKTGKVEKVNDKLTLVYYKKGKNGNDYEGNVCDRKSENHGIE